MLYSSKQEDEYIVLLQKYKFSVMLLTPDLSNAMKNLEKSRASHHHNPKFKTIRYTETSIY